MYGIVSAILQRLKGDEREERELDDGSKQRKVGLGCALRKNLHWFFQSRLLEDLGARSESRGISAVYRLRGPPVREDATTVLQLFGGAAQLPTTSAPCLPSRDLVVHFPALIFSYEI